MKKLSVIFTFILFSLSCTIAQPTPPTPPTTSTETTRSKSTKINININSNQKLKLNANNHDIDMDLDFERVTTIDIEKILVRHLGKPTSSSRRTNVWANKDKGYCIKLKKGNLEASFDKDKLSAQDLEKLLDFTKDVFDELGWEVDVDGL